MTDAQPKRSSDPVGTLVCFTPNYPPASELIPFFMPIGPREPDRKRWAEADIDPSRDPLRCGKPDEQQLWLAVLDGERPRDAGERLGIHWKRVCRLCEKWCRKGIYDYGVAEDLGWPIIPGVIDISGMVDWAVEQLAL